jgi:hypothetical protein
MSNLWSRVIGDKKEWRSMEARAEALPRDYRIVYGEMKRYLWRFTAGDGRDVVAVLKDVLGRSRAARPRASRSWTSPVRTWRPSATSACAAPRRTPTPGGLRSTATSCTSSDL